jgi:hypothetical protein
MSGWRNVVDRVAGLFSARRKPPLIYILAPAYKPLSGGSRSVHLLCHHLNGAGFEAYLVLKQGAARGPGLRTPVLSTAIEKRRRFERREPIVIYPEVVPGNPLGAQIVVRFLLNKPGLLNPGAETTFGADDLFFSFAPEHVPRGARAFDLFMPLVDRSIYFPPAAGAPRDLFTVVLHRASPDPATFPAWLTPFKLVSRQEPIPAAELAALYRRSRAMVTFERSTTVFEAELCGCPVICIAGEHFREDIYQPRFKGLGLVWGWHPDRLAKAAEETAQFQAIYAELEANLGSRLKAAIAWVLEQRGGGNGAVGLLLDAAF